MDTFLVYEGQRDEVVVNGYIDVSFQSNKDDFISLLDFIFCLNGGAIDWKSQSKTL